MPTYYRHRRAVRGEGAAGSSAKESGTSEMANGEKVGEQTDARGSDGDSVPEERSSSGTLSATALVAIAARTTGADPDRMLASPLGVVFDVVARQIELYGASSAATSERLMFLFSELSRRLDQIEREGRLKAAELRDKLDDPSQRRIIADAAGVMLGSDRIETAIVLSDLVMKKLLAKPGDADDRFSARGVRTLDTISTNQLLVLGLVTFLNTAPNSHPTSVTVHSALSSGNLDAYDAWLESVLDRLVPKTGVNLEDLEDLRSVGLLTAGANGVSPGEVPRAGTAIQGLLALYQMMGQRAIDPGAREAKAVRRADELLQPADGARLALDRPILAAYWPTPFGFCLAQPLLARFTDLNTRDVAQQPK